MAHGTILVQSEDDTVAGLLRDVLVEAGYALCGPRGHPNVAVVFLASFGRGASVRELKAELDRPEPVVAVLPFEDEAYVALAGQLGAARCFALGRPLYELVDAVREAAADPVTRRTP